MQGIRVRIYGTDEKHLYRRIVRKLGGTIVQDKPTVAVITSKKYVFALLHGPEVVHCNWLSECWKHQTCLPTHKWSITKTFLAIANKVGWTHRDGTFYKHHMHTTHIVQVARDVDKCHRAAAIMMQKHIRGHQARIRTPNILVAITGVPGLPPFHTHPRATIAILLPYLRVFHNADTNARIMHNGQYVHNDTRLAHIDTDGPLLLHCQ